MTIRLFPILVAVFLIAGCSNNEYSNYAPVAPAAEAASVDALEKDAGQSDYMAYEHSINLETNKDEMLRLHQAGEAACKAVAERGCILLESRLDTGKYASAHLSFRAKPDAIKTLISTFAASGNVVSQTTTAEDLSGPIRDSSKQLTMLKDYRASLEGLRTKSSSDLNALITLNKELAQVQTEIEAASGNDVYLRQRVDMEILRVSISSTERESFWYPISSSFSDFGSNLSNAISNAITFIAYALPWGFLLILVVWVGRKLWKFRRKTSV